MNHSLFIQRMKKVFTLKLRLKKWTKTIITLSKDRNDDNGDGDPAV